MAKIVLIEDEVAVREMLMDELSAQGHEIIEAVNGEEGLKKIMAWDPDLILCDRAMPGISGYDVLQRLRQFSQFSDIPFVFLTALADPRDKSSVEHLNPAGYIEKPVDFKVLAEKINALARKK